MRLMDVDVRILAEHDGRRVRQPVHEPALAEIVVDDEHAVDLQMGPHVAEGLFREHIALEPHAREARLQGERIDQREHDEVVLPR